MTRADYLFNKLLRALSYPLILLFRPLVILVEWLDVEVDENGKEIKGDDKNE